MKSHYKELLVQSNLNKGLLKRLAFPKLSSSYNNHLLKPVKLTKLTCLKLAKGYKRTLFHVPELRKVTRKFLDFYVDGDLTS